MPHSFARRSRAACDEGGHGLGYMLSDILRGFFFGRAADLADHHDGFGGRVGLEKLQQVDERRSYNWVATEPDARGLSQAQFGELPNGLIG